MHNTTTPNAAQPPSGTARLTLGFALVAVVLAGVLRLLPHPFNMTLIGALGLWGGARLNPWLGACLPLAAWGVTDFVLWKTGGVPSFSPFVYASFGVYVLLGLLLRRTTSPGRIAATCLLASVQFFLVTNFAAWLSLRVDAATMPEGQWWSLESGYPRYADNTQGLLTAYAFGLPFAGKDPAGLAVPLPLGFFGNLVVGDLVFCGALFGVHALLLHWIARRREPAPAPVQP